MMYRIATSLGLLTLIVAMLQLPVSFAFAELALRATDPIRVGNDAMVPVAAEGARATIECAPTGRCIVVWRDSDKRIWRTVYDREMNPSTVSSAYLGRSDSAFEVSYTDGKLLILWTYRQEKLEGQVVDAASGEQLDEPIEVMDWLNSFDYVGLQYPRLVSAGGNGKFLAAWALYLTEGDPYVYNSHNVAMARWIGLDGQMLGDLVEPYAADEEHEVVEMDFDGTHMRLLSGAEQIDSGSSEELTHLLTADVATEQFSAASVPLETDVSATRLNQACMPDGVCLLAWTETSSSRRELHTGLMDASGQWLSPPAKIQDFRPGLDVYVFSTSNQFLVLTGSRGHVSMPISFFSVSAQGITSPPTQLQLPADETWKLKDVAHDEEYFRLLVTDSNERLVELYFDSRGELKGRNGELTYRTPAIQDVALLSAGNQTLLVWSSDAADNFALYGTPIDAEGVPSNPQGTLITSSMSSKDIAGDGDDSGIALAWATSNGRLQVKRVTIEDGELSITAVAEVDDLAAPLGRLRVATAGESVVVALTENYRQSGASPATVLVADSDGQVARFTPSTSESTTSGLECTGDGDRCVAMTTISTDTTTTWQFASFRPFHSSSSPTVTSDYLTRPRSGRVQLKLSRLDEEFFVSLLEREGETSTQLDIYRLSTDGQLELARNVTIPATQSLGAPFDYGEGLAVPLQRHQEPYGFATGLLRLDAGLAPIDEAPVDPTINGLRTHSDVFSRRPAGGFFAAARVFNPYPDGQPLLYVQAFAIPGEDGDECHVDADCHSMACIDDTCITPVDTDAGEHNPDVDAGSSDSMQDERVEQGGCSSTGNGPLGANWALVLLMVAVGRRLLSQLLLARP